MFNSSRGPRNDGSPYVSQSAARAVPDILSTGDTAVVGTVISPNYLATLRLARACSQRQLADFAGIEAGTYSRLERGLCEPALSTAYALAAALGVSVTRIWPPEHNVKRAVSSRRRAAAAASEAVPDDRTRRRLRDNRHAIPAAALPPHPAEALASWRPIPPQEVGEHPLGDVVDLP